MERIICLIIGYIFGNVFQAGYWFGRFHHIDIRNYGSGNAGTTNVTRTLGKKAGIITYLIDTFKAVFAALLVHFTVGRGSENEMLLFLYSGFGVVLGHNFPFYLKFKGGKGIAATSGVVLSLFLFPKHCWILTILGILTFGGVTIISKYVSLGSLVFVSTFFIEMVIYGTLGWLPLSGMALYEAYGIVFVLAALAFVRHRANIKRLLSGTERRIGAKNTEQA